MPRIIITIIACIAFLSVNAQSKAEKKKKRSKVLASSTMAPVIPGKNFQNDLNSDTLRFKGKITVLDFWYMGCGPCIKAMPQIDSLKQKYAERGVEFYAINSIDNNENAIKDLPAFLKKNPITYSIILTDRSVTDKYLIEVWPTFYVIDQNGKIHYGTYGLSDNLYDRLSRALEELL